MKLRSIKTKTGAWVEALQSGTIDGWVRLSSLKCLDSIGKKFSQPNDLTTNLLRVLELGPEGWQWLSEEIDQCAPSPLDAESMIILPFPPRSFRDFLLFEQHFIDASRGFAKRFLPKKYKIAAAYEAMTGRVFPKFKPSAMWYKQPLYYMGNPLNFVTTGAEVAFPRYTKALDYELELGAILAKPLFNSTPKEAENAIGGYVVVNDFSARDIQMAEMHSGFGPQKSKHFINAMSGIVVTADEINPQINKLQASVTIDGLKRVDCTTAKMQYSLGEAIAYASREEHLYPGELFGSGTLPGGCAMENGHWLQPGHVLTLKIDNIAELTNHIVK